MASQTLRLLIVDQRSQDQFRVSLEELKAWVKTVPQSVMAYYRVQVEGLAEWHDLESVKLDSLGKSAAPDEELETTIIDALENLETQPRVNQRRQAQTASAPDNRRTAERRRHQRVNMRRRTIIVAGNVVYRTFTVDASVDGLRLEHPVPRELQGRVVDCYLSSQDLLTGVQLKAMMVENGNQAVRLKFLEQDSKSRSTLGNWLSSLAKKSA